MVVPVSGYGHPILPPPSKQLRVRPDGGMGPIPLYTGWTLGPVPKHIAAWASAAKRSPVDSTGMDASSAGTGRQRSATVDLGAGVGGREFGPGRATAAAAAGVDAVLATIAAGTPGARLPLVPGPDETFVSRDTGVTGEGIRAGVVNVSMVDCKLTLEGVLAPCLLAC